MEFDLEIRHQEIDDDQADTDVGTDVATGLRVYSLTSVTDVDRAGTDVGTDVAKDPRQQGCLPTLVTDVIRADTDVGTDMAEDWSAEHR